MDGICYCYLREAVWRQTCLVLFFVESVKVTLGCSALFSLVESWGCPPGCGVRFRPALLLCGGAAGEGEHNAPLSLDFAEDVRSDIYAQQWMTLGVFFLSEKLPVLRG